jgi:hypothetical protein
VVDEVIFHGGRVALMGRGGKIVAGTTGNTSFLEVNPRGIKFFFQLLLQINFLY